MRAARLSAARTIFALRRHELERGKLPARLEDLVPEFAKELPLDPFDGKPLRYSAEERIVWSVGKDLEDSGGSEAENPENDRSEPTWKIGHGQEAGGGAAGAPP